MDTIAFKLGSRYRGGRQFGLAGLAYALGGVLALLAATSVSAPSLSLVAGGVLFVGIGAWMFLSERYELTLGVLMVYLGVADGFLKLKTGSSVMTLGRDALLYAIVIGVLLRGVLREQSLVMPPMSGYVLLFSLLILAETVNPGTGGVGHALAATRPDLEFVPLFFFGYHIVRTRSRLRGFLAILLFVSAANGVVSMIQMQESPSQLASWGPGYAQKVNGSGTISGRTFQGSDGKTYVRPFGLQSDAGGGGNTGMLGIPAALAFLGALRRRRIWPLMALFGAGAVLAIVSSEGRGAVLAAFAALLAYIALSVVSRRLIPTLVGVVVGAVVVIGVISLVSSGVSSGAFSRYATIAPGKVLGTAQQSRGFALAEVPGYVARFPFGAGLGSTGPASGVGRTVSGLDGETEFTFMITEAGIAGLLLLLAYHLKLLAWSVRCIRAFADTELRVMLAAISAPLFGILALYYGGPATASSPLAPYLWFAGGVLAYWFTEGVRLERQRA